MDVNSSFYSTPDSEVDMHDSSITLATETDAESMPFISPKNTRESPKEILNRVHEREAKDSGTPPDSKNGKDSVHLANEAADALDLAHIKHNEESSPTDLLDDYFQVDHPSVSKAIAHTPTLPTPGLKSPPSASPLAVLPKLIFPISGTKEAVSGRISKAQAETRNHATDDLPSIWPLASSSSPQKLSLSLAMEIFSEAPTEPLPRQGLILSEALAIMYACTTYAAVYFLLRHVDGSMLWESMALQLINGWLVGFIVCLGVHMFFGGRVERIPQNSLHFLGRMVGNLARGLAEGYRRGRGE